MLGADLVAGLLEPPEIGTVPAFTLEFTPEKGDPFSLDETDTRAEIEASLPGGLDAGSYRIVLERLADQPVKTITGALHAHQRLRLDLRLGWRMRAGASLPRVARLVVTGAAEGAIGLRRTLTLDAVEEVVARLRPRRLSKPVQATDPLALAKAILADAGLPQDRWRDHPGAAAPSGGTPPPEGLPHAVPVLDALRQAGARMEAAGNRHGRGAFLLRDGVLHLGTGRDVPFLVDGKPALHKVAASGMLLAARVLPPVPKDPAFVPPPGDAEAQPPLRRRFELVLVGAPRVLPGDAVAFPGPAEADAAGALLGGLKAAAGGLFGLPEDAGGPELTLYVESVAHRQQRASGFLTTLTGVEIDLQSAAPDAVWDVHTKLDRGGPLGLPPLADGTGVGELAAELAEGGRRNDGRRHPQVAEVRDQVSAKAQDRAPLSLRVLEGLAASGPGQERPAIDRAVERKAAYSLTGVASLSPFAHGPYGLVLPRLAGMRVLLAYRDGVAEDPLEIGAFRAAQDAVPDARPGDWWLVLPATAPAKGDGSDAVAVPAGPASDDLTDAQGNRIIEVGALTIRIGKGALNTAGERPEPAAGAITIEHTNSADGRAVIVIEQSGAIRIEAAAALTLKSAGPLTLDAPSVKVKLGPGGSMDVEGGA